MNEFFDSNCEDDMKKDVSTNVDLDSLTQIANRQKFNIMLNEAVKKSHNTVCYLSILLIDIDYFKEYIDKYGLLSGNDCLRQVAFSLQGTLKRAGDLVARWDHEKFVCILSDTDPAGAATMAQKMSHAIIDLGIPNSASSVADVITISVGVVTSILTDEIASDKLVEKADHALSIAIKTGRNKIAISNS